MPPPFVEIYERGGLWFDSAVLFKPLETGGSNSLAFTLAPLLVQQAPPDRDEIGKTLGAGRTRLGQAGVVSGFGSLSLSNQVLVLDREKPTIYYETDTVELKGRTHARFCYAWCYRIVKGVRKAGGVPLQGVRITLDSSGSPVIWEMLTDDSGLDVIFVARSLEEAARAQFGPALPGRRHSIERSVPEARTVVVARVIDDGPVAMGPIVYLNRERHSATTLICRCMPSQAKALEGTRVYDLVPMPLGTPESLLMKARMMSGSHPSFWPGSRSGHARLEKVLRLPDTF